MATGRSLRSPVTYGRPASIPDASGEIVAEMGEHFVGAYLRMKEGFPLVTYNVPIPNECVPDEFRSEAARKQKLKQGELDVVAVNFGEKKAVLCEVITHIREKRGQALLPYPGESSPKPENNFRKMARKLLSANAYGKLILKGVAVEIQCWCTHDIQKGVEERIDDLLQQRQVKVEFITGKKYVTRLEELLDMARKDPSDRKDPFFRVLQIVEHVGGRK